jgi:hypothetical protein
MNQVDTIPTEDITVFACSDSDLNRKFRRFMDRCGKAEKVEFPPADPQQLHMMFGERPEKFTIVHGSYTINNGARVVLVCNGYYVLGVRAHGGRFEFRPVAAVASARPDDEVLMHVIVRLQTV